MHNKPLFLLLLFVFIGSNYSSAQMFFPMNKEVWSNFQSEKLYVVLENNEESEFNEAFKNACTTSWTYNDVEFIDSSKYESLKKEKGNFFLVQALYPLKMGKKHYVLNQLELKQINKKGREIIVASIFQESLDATYSDEVNLIHLPLYVHYIQDLCVKALNEDKSVVKQRASRLAQVKTKPLYILESHYTDHVPNLAALKEQYGGEVVEISIEDLSEKIEAQEDVHLFVFNKGVDKQAPVLRNKYGNACVFNLKSGDMLYKMQVYTSKSQPAGLSKYLCRNWSK